MKVNAIDAIDTSELVKKKTDYSTKIEEKVPDHGKFSGKMLDEKVKQANVGTKTDISDFITKISFDKKVRRIM